MNKQLTSALLATLVLATVGAAWTAPVKAEQNTQITSQINPNGVYCDFDDDGNWDCYEY